MIAACHGPSQTGPKGMVGTLVDSAGKPVVGVVVSSLEAEARTDPQGHFSVPWKDPDTSVIFPFGGAVWNRVLLESDPAEVEIRLPELAPIRVDCPPDPCQLRLVWAVEDGLSATATGACVPGQPIALGGVPSMQPQISCRNDGVEVPFEAVLLPGVIALMTPAEPLRIDVQSTEGRPPENCEVHVSDRLAEAAGDGFWTGMARAGDVVQVRCEGRSAWPVAVVAGQGTIPVDWSRTGPTLDLIGMLPDADTVWVAPEGSTLWVSLQSDDAGVFALPPLAAGRYRFRIDGPADAKAIDWPDPGRAGALELHALGDSLAGVLDLDRDLPSGRLPVSGP